VLDSSGMEEVSDRGRGRPMHGDVLAEKLGGACVYHQLINQGRRHPLFNLGRSKSNPEEG
jgi:hypothetical protein